MKKVNFNSLRNIEVPENWMQKALSLQENQSSVNSRAYTQLFRVITVAACLVLVCVLSLPLYRFSETEVNLPRTPLREGIYISQPASERESDSTEFESSYSVNSEVITPSEKYDATHPSQIVTYPTETSVENTGVSLPSQGEESTLGASGSEIPTLTSGVIVDPPSQPTVSGNTTPTKQFPTESTSQGGYVGVVSVSCFGSFSAELLPEGEKVYCSIYDTGGIILGDSDLFSSQHQVDSVTKKNGSIYVSYNFKKAGLSLAKGKYSYCFYLENGQVVFEGRLTI